MRARAIALVVAFGAMDVEASEGTYQAVLYRCNAKFINRTAVEACAQSHPELGSRATAALSIWSKRYGEKAEAASQKCNAGSSDGMPQLFEEMARNIRTQASSRDKGYCQNFIDHLEGRTDPDGLFWK